MLMKKQKVITKLVITRAEAIQNLIRHNNQFKMFL